jgi:hypothetical protein
MILMRKNVLLSLCLAMLVLTVSAAGEVTQDIEKICSFKFPGLPRITEVPGVRSYLYSTDSCSYLVQIKPSIKAGVVTDSATLRAFYGGAVKGILRGFRGSLISDKQIRIKGLSGEQLEYVRVDQHHQALSVCSRILLLRGRLIIYTFSAPYSRFTSLRYLQDHFFVSFAVDEIGSALRSAAGHDSSGGGMAAADTGSTPTPIYDSVRGKLDPAPVHSDLVRPGTFHFAISFVVCILLLLALVYSIVRWRKRKEIKK